MAVRRYIGHNLQAAPHLFRALTGAVFHTGLPGTKTESLFSRKSETANLDAMKAQHNLEAQDFDATRNTSIHITNSSSQIGSLNDGRSAQTPAGFFYRSIDAAKRGIKGTWKLKELP